MADQKKDQTAAATAVTPKPVEKTPETRRDNPGLRTDDPFIKDMSNIANNAELDGNARIQSPQIAGNGEGPREDEG